MAAQAGGICITLGVIVGVAAGMATRQPSLGLVIGLATGVILAIGISLRDFIRKGKR